MCIYGKGAQKYVWPEMVCESLFSIKLECKVE